MRCAIVHGIGIVLVALLVGQAFGQTSIGQTSGGTSVDLATQGRNPDFANFSFTRPVTVGSALPSSCQSGQLYFNTAAPAGANLYACTAPNVWTLQAGGATMSAQLGDFAPLLAGGALTVGAGCTSITPCNVRIGNTVHSFRGAATVTPSGASTGLVFVYIDGSGNLVAGSAVGLACTGCTYAPGITSFPFDSIPLFNWTLTNGAFDPAGETDFRAFLSGKNLTAGTGILIAENAGASSIAIDPTLVPVQVPAPATSSTPCSTGQFSFDNNYYYVCVAPNVWKRVALSSF